MSNHEITITQKARQSTLKIKKSKKRFRLTRKPLVFNDLRRQGGGARKSLVFNDLRRLTSARIMPRSRGQTQPPGFGYVCYHHPHKVQPKSA